MTEEKDQKITLAEHVAETHRDKVPDGNVVTGDIVSGDVVEKEEEKETTPDASEEAGPGEGS